jgi:hypothetical protein
MFEKGAAEATKGRMRRFAPMLLALLVSIFFAQLIGSASIADAAGFSSPAFRRVWERTDLPVITGATQRSFLWGPEPFVNTFEPYVESPNGQRRVDYFDKARMEISRPDLNPNMEYYVTNGLIVKEMTTGLLQRGDNTFVQRIPAYDVPIAGDQDASNALAPTYASFYALSTFYNSEQKIPGVQPDPSETRFPLLDKQRDRINERAREVIFKGGAIGRNDALGNLEGLNYVYYERTLGHNIPKIFWDFLNISGPIFDGRNIVFGTVFNWVTTMGYPITDAYWVKTRVAGVERDVLVQLFERRILTYTPTNPDGYKVEMGNVGRHYYNWRYNSLYDIALPQQSSAEVKPEAGFPGTVFAMRFFRFIQEEQLDITVTTPDGRPCPTNTCGILTSAVPTGFAFFVIQLDSTRFQPGQYTLYVRGLTSGNEAKAYFFIVGIPGFNLPPR